MTSQMTLVVKSLPTNVGDFRDVADLGRKSQRIKIICIYSKKKKEDKRRL